jgi:two-component sensor histidine kinase
MLNTSSGIPEEEAEKIRHLDFGVAVCGCVARDGKRMIQENIQCSYDPRVKLVKSFGVQAYCCHPLMAHGNLIGTLSFGTSTRYIFTPDEIALMKQVADQIAVAMERIRINMVLRKNEENLKNSLKEKEALLKEIHHRVKNNMQVISSLVSLQSTQSQDPVVREVLRDVSYRVRSMAMVHEKLYQATDLARIDFSKYIESLLSYLWHAYGKEASGIRLVKELETVLLPVDKAIPLGLILNELVNNALKHAYPEEKKGEVTVSLKKNKEKGLILTVRDYGRGLPPGFDWRETESLGLRLLQMLSSQLSAVVEVKSNNGSEFRVILGGIQN